MSAGTSGSQTRPYQGYPCVNPAVIDVPSVDAATAQQWAHLPRRPGRLRGVDEALSPAASEPKEDKIELDPVVYIDVPEDGGQTTPSREKNEDAPPVVYIDLPEEGGSSVTQGPATPAGAESDGSEFVQDTIFYDPFENRRIGAKPEEDVAAGPSRPPVRVIRPQPSGSGNREVLRLDLTSPGAGSSGSSTPNLPPSLAKQQQIYQRLPTPDELNLTPLPVNDFPEPPPAYSELDRNTPTVTEQPRPPTREPPPSEPIEEPLRTEVITQDVIPVHLTDTNRKLLHCQHCGYRVHTLVVQQTGFVTHVIACITLIFCNIFALYIYCSNCFKYKNHYCTRCSKKIAYQIPSCCCCCSSALFYERVTD